jgi:type I restriction enzyme, S subunit
MTSIFLDHFDDLLATPEDVEQLNNAILEMAVRGKLTNCEPGDGSAKELLDRIRTGKEKLGKTGSPLRVKEEEKPFNLPQGWEWVRWDDVSFQIGDVDHKMPDEIPDGIPYISPRDFIGKEDISFATAKKISRKDYDDLAEKIKPERGDIIFPRYGTIGVNRFVSVDFEFLASYSCCIIKHMKGLMNPRYVFFYSISPFLQQETQKYVNKTTQPNVGIKSIQKFLFPLPPLAEQQRIVARVEELFAQTRALAKELTHSQSELDGLNQSALSHLLASETPEDFNQHWEFIAEHFDLLFQAPEHVAPLHQSILELAVRGKLTRREAGDEPAKELLRKVSEEKTKLRKDKSLTPVKENEKPFEIPNSWEWARLQDLTETITKGSSPNWQGIQYVDKGEGVLFITSKNVGQFSLIMDEESYVEEKFNQIEPRSILKNGDILMNIVGASIGRSAIFNLDTVANINQAVCLIRLANYDLLNKDFFILFFNSSTCIGYMFDKQVDNARANLSMGNIANFAIPVPPLAEQERIVKRVEQLLSLCDALEGRLYTAEEERGKLVAAVMTGVGG